MLTEKEQRIYDLINEKKSSGAALSEKEDRIHSLITEKMGVASTPATPAVNTEDQGLIPDSLETFARSAVDTGTMGLSENAIAAAKALNSDAAGSFTDKYYAEKAQEQAKMDALTEQNPAAYYTGTIAGAVGSGVAMPGLGVAAGFSKLNTAKKLLEAAKTGAKIGALSGAVGGEAETLRGDIGGTVEDIAGGGVGGAIGGVALTGLAGAAGGALKGIANSKYGTRLVDAYKLGQKTDAPESLGGALNKETQDFRNTAINTIKNYKQAINEKQGLYDDLTKNDLTTPVNAESVFLPELSAAKEMIAKLNPDSIKSKDMNKLVEAMELGVKPVGPKNIDDILTQIDDLKAMNKTLANEPGQVVADTADIFGNKMIPIANETSSSIAKNQKLISELESQAQSVIKNQPSLSEIDAMKDMLYKLTKSKDNAVKDLANRAYGKADEMYTAITPEGTDATIRELNKQINVPQQLFNYVGTKKGTLPTEQKSIANIKKLTQFAQKEDPTLAKEAFINDIRPKFEKHGIDTKILDDLTGQESIGDLRNKLNMEMQSTNWLNALLANISGGTLTGGTYKLAYHAGQLAKEVGAEAGQVSTKVINIMDKLPREQVRALIEGTDKAKQYVSAIVKERNPNIRANLIFRMQQSPDTQAAGKAVMSLLGITGDEE